MKVIFLDIDGVLNSEESVDRAIEAAHNRGDERPTMDELNCDAPLTERFVSFIEQHNIKIVLSSSWRWHTLESTIEHFKDTPFKCLIPYMVGVTPRFDSRIRGEEIQWYLDNHLEITKYVIVDDDTDMLEHQHFIHVNDFTGLTDKNFEEILRFL